MTLKRWLGFLPALLIMLLMSPDIAAQNRAITGKIIDKEAGTPLAGVSVAIKSSKQNTLTDEKGEFRINVGDKEDVLVISHVGFIRQEVKLGNDASINILLVKQNVSLDDVVVVGYGAKKKSEVLGAVSTIKAAEIADIPAPNIAGALRNRLAGVGVSANSGRPGASISINIRNARTNPSGLTGTEPLYVIDGIIVDKGQFDALDPALVEELTILKDATAAIYGATGAKGVVLITTKRGKIGKTTLTYNGYAGYTDAARKPNMLSAYEHALLLNETYDAKQNVSAADYFSQADLEYLKTNPIKSWYDEMWQASLTQRHNLSMSGGNDKITFFAGGNFQNENANYAGMSMDRYGFRSGMTATVIPGLKMDVNFTVNHNIRNSQNGFDETDQNFFMTLVKTPKWVPLKIGGKPVFLGSGNVRNPLALTNSGYYQQDKNTSYQVNTALNYSPAAVKGLTIRFQFAQSGGNAAGKTYSPAYKLYDFLRAGNNNLLYSDQLNITPLAPDGVASGVGVSAVNARITNQYSRSSSYQGILTVNYVKKIGDHSFSAMAGADRTKGGSQSARFYYTDQQISNIDETWAFNQTTFVNQGISATENIKQSFLGRLSYDFDKKYFFDAIARYDASTRFAVDNIWGFSYNVGVGWNIGNENFFRDRFPFINGLRLKVNYGVTGDDRPGDVGTRLWQENFKVDLANTGYIYGENQNASLNPTRFPNPNITWEKAGTWNVGIEAQLFNNKLDFNLQAFHRLNYDQFDAYASQSVPMFAGFTPPAVNYAQTVTDGLELSIGYRTNIGRDIRITADFNIALNSSYQKKGLMNPYRYFENTPEDWQYFVGTNAAIYNTNNFGLISKGLLKTQQEVDALLAKYPNYTLFTVVPQRGWMYYEDVNKDGRIDERDYVPMFKHPNPVVTGITLGFSYRALSLNANIAANLGGKVFYDDQAKKGPTKTDNVDAFWKDHWTVDNINGLFPRTDDPGLSKQSTFWAVNGTMIRVNNLTLSYTLPQQILSCIGMNSARIMATGNNLWTIVNPLPYKDPYTSSVLDYPTLRTISVGLNVSL
jgi:TonB-linked SusC/RagA family outer membrane protein